MVENNVNINELIIKEPRLQEEWEASDEVLNNHIADAYNRVCLEFYKQNIDIKSIGASLTLFEGTLIKNQITNWTESRNRVKRIIVKIKQPFKNTKPFNIVLEGSNNNERGGAELALLTVSNNYATGVFYKDFDYYRIKAESKYAIDLRSEVYLGETVFDDLIIFKALENFFTAKYRKNDDSFSSKMQMYRNKFESELNVIINYYKNEVKKTTNKTIRVIL